MTTEELQHFLDKAFTHFPFKVVEVGSMFAVIEQQTSEHNLRPGGTVSGPTLMTMADTGLYAAILAQIGPVALAVTTNININFLNKPEPGVLRAETRLLKLGKRLAVGEVTITCNGNTNPVAHATGTYSIPPQQ
ncbi:MAG: PaaI family thioesterase [Pseudomonadales bacterium]|nr:PaaI family thioesterase [Pseudomonadales bacterium]